MLMRQEGAGQGTAMGDLCLASCPVPKSFPGQLGLRSTSLLGSITGMKGESRLVCAGVWVCRLTLEALLCKQLEVTVAGPVSRRLHRMEQGRQGEGCWLALGTWWVMTSMPDTEESWGSTRLPLSQFHLSPIYQRAQSQDELSPGCPKTRPPFRPRPPHPPPRYCWHPDCMVGCSFNTGCLAPWFPHSKC